MLDVDAIPMTSENVAEQDAVESAAAVSAKAVDAQLIDELVSRAQAEGLQSTGEGGLLQQLTRRLLESALEGEITDHLGYDKHAPAGKNGGNSRNGTRSETVLTDVRPVEIVVPRDRDGSFEPKCCGSRDVSGVTRGEGMAGSGLQASGAHRSALTLRRYQSAVSPRPAWKSWSGL
ncbi:hypothetical protein STEPF1_04450 [Streptomyces sp. F-1]|nr:hypothetical protein STEPF1_04450 [Streptomyces sp. F-1]